MNKLEITSINIKTVTDEPPVMAYCSVVFNEAFAVRKIRIIHKTNSITGESVYLVFMPSMKTKDGRYSDICHPINQETRDKLQTAILTAYIGQLKSVVR